MSASNHREIPNKSPVSAYQGKRVMVAGAARSGIAAAELLLSLGVRVMLYDAKPQSAFANLPTSLAEQGCEYCFEADPEGLLERSDLIVLSPGIPLDAPLVKTAYRMKVPVIGELAFAASCATQEIIAVTGTNGKTTTVSLLGEIFRQAGRNAFVAGNIGYPLSSAVKAAKPDDLIICEVSSFQLETADDFHPDIAVLLNITPDHIDRHGSFEAYAALKKSIFSNMTRSDYAILNRDDGVVREFASAILPQVLWFSCEDASLDGAYVKDEWIVLAEQGNERKICPVADLKIPGKHNLQNALAACAVASTAGVPGPVIAYALKNFVGVEHRIEFVLELNEVRYLNDSKGTNPDSTIKAVEAVKTPTVIILGGYDKQISFDALAASIMDSGRIKAAVLIGQTAKKIEKALEDTGFMGIHHATGLEAAVHLAHQLSNKGDTVLFSPACSSFDMFDNYEQRGREFKRMVAELASGNP